MKFFYLIAFFSLFKSLVVNAQFVQQGNKLVGTGAGGSLVHQGRSVAVSGDGNTMIVGGIFDDNTIVDNGAVWIYIKQGNNWIQQGNKIFPNDNVGSARFGSSVSLSYDGNTAIIGGEGDNSYKGAAWIFKRQNNIWTQKQKLVMADPASPNPAFGSSVAISGDGSIAIIGANYDNYLYGAACIFNQSNGVWAQQVQKLVPQNINYSQPQFGMSVSISASGATVVIGNNRDIGAVVYARLNGVWTQQGPPLKGFDNIVNAAQGEGVAISGDGNTIISGGYYDEPAGAAWIFTLSGGVWKQQGSKLVGSNYIVNRVRSYQGSSVQISYDGNIAVIGSYTDNNNTGAVWVFSRNSGTWTEQQKIVPNDPSGPLVHFGDGWDGCSISWDGNTIVIGGGDDANGAGAAWVFKNSPIEICPSTNKTFTSNILGNAYQWQVNANDGNGFINVSNNANYTGATMLNLQLSNIPSSWNGYKYRCILNGGAKFSSIITLKISSYWNGTVDNKWETAGNWSCGIVPDKYTDVYINPGKPRYPVVTTNGIAECKSLTVSPGTSFNVNATKSIRIYGH